MFPNGAGYPAGRFVANPSHELRTPLMLTQTLLQVALAIAMATGLAVGMGLVMVAAAAQVPPGFGPTVADNGGAIALMAAMPASPVATRGPLLLSRLRYWPTAVTDLRLASRDCRTRPRTPPARPGTFGTTALRAPPPLKRPPTRTQLGGGLGARAWLCAGRVTLRKPVANTPCANIRRSVKYAGVGWLRLTGHSVRD